MEKGERCVVLKTLNLVLRFVLGGVFLYSCVEKIADPDGFAKILQSYEIFPKWSVSVITHLLPVGEFMLGAFILFHVFPRISLISAQALLSAFILILIAGKIMGHVGNCGCFSTGSTTSSSLAIGIAKNIVLIAIAFFINQTNPEKVSLVNETNN